MSGENNIPQNEDKLLNEIKRLGLNKINNLKKFEKDADRYERALFNFLFYEYPPPDYIVLFDHQFEGKGEIERQLDVAVFKVPNFKTPFILGESKRYTTRKVQIDIADCVAGMKEHVNASYAILATLRGFSINTIKRANFSNIFTIIIDLEEADRLNWREIARRYFPWDKNFQPVIADALYEFARLPEKITPSEDDFWRVIDAMEDILYEEWQAFFNNAKYVNLNYYELLYFIAMKHYDSGWRFNAIQYLEGWLDEEKLRSLLEYERDEETIELIEGQLNWLKKLS